MVWLEFQRQLSLSVPSDFIDLKNANTQLGPGSSPWRRIFDRLFFGGNDWCRRSFQKTGPLPVF